MATFRSLSDLRNTTTEQMIPGLIDAIRYNDQLTALMVGNSFVTDRPQIKLNRIASRSAAPIVAAGGTITSVALSANAATFDFDTIVSQFEVASQGNNQYSSFTDVVASEMVEAAKAISLTIATNIFTNGTNTVSLTNQNINSAAVATSGALKLADLDNLSDLVLSKSANMAFIGRPAVVNAVVRELRSTAGGLQYSDLAGTTFTVPQYLGIPLVKSQFAPAGELYLVNMDDYKIGFGTYADMQYGPFGYQEIGNVEARLAKLYRLYASVFSVLFNTAGAGKLTNCG